MKTLRNIAPALLVLLMLVVVAFAIGLTSRDETEKVAAPSVDNSPNAGLSNEKLIAAALSNMEGLTSYRFQILGLEPAGEVTPTRLTVIGYEQPPGEGVTLSARGERQAGGATASMVSTFADQAAQFPHEMLITGDEVYFSLDNGGTWSPFVGDMWVPPVVLLCTWGTPDSEGWPRCADMLRLWKFTDADPRTEILAGVPTRHLVADLFALDEPASPHTNLPMVFTYEAPSSGTIHLWVSTDETPMVRQIRYEAAMQNTADQESLEPLVKVAFSPDGKMLAAAHMGVQGTTPPFSISGSEYTVAIWNLDSPGSEPTRLAIEKEASLTALGFSPDGKALAAALLGGNIERGVLLWDAANLSAPPAVLTFAGGDTPPALAFSPDSKMLGVANSSGIYLWEAPYKGDGKLAVPGSFHTLAFSPDGHTLATGSDNCVLLYNLNDLKAAPSTLGQNGAAAIAFSPDGKMLAAKDYGSPGDSTPDRLHLWNLASPGRPVASLEGGGSPAFSPDGEKLASLSSWSLVYEVDQLVAQGSTAPYMRPLGTSCNNWDRVLSADWLKLADACYEGKVEVRDLQWPEGESQADVLWWNPADAAGITFSVTWSWDGFNDTFEEIKPPEPQTIKQP
jgi:WD40 repeat protein